MDKSLRIEIVKLSIGLPQRHRASPSAALDKAICWILCQKIVGVK